MRKPKTTDKRPEPILPDRAAVHKLLRRDRGPDERISYGNIAKNTGIHVTHVCKIFTGSRRPSARTVRKIAAYIGCSSDTLMSALRI